MIPLRSQYPNRLSYNPYSARSRAAGMQGVNFGVDMQIPGMPAAPEPITVEPKNRFNMNPTPEPQKQVPGVNQPMDFAAEYAKLNANRPNRLAYQQAVNEGEPTIQRGKWAKLAALLAGAGTGLSEGPTAGMNLGLSSYYEPQRRATEKYNKKLIGLERLAGYEDSDMANQIKALEVKENQYWNERRESRADKAQAGADKLADAQIGHLKYDTMFSMADKDGNTWLYDKADPSKRVFLAKTGESTFEKLQEAAKALKQKLEIEDPYNVAHDERMAASALAVANANNPAGTTAKPLTPEQQQAKVYSDLTKLFNTHPELKGLNMDDYVTAIIGPGGNSIVGVKPANVPGKFLGMFGGHQDTPQDTKVKNIIRDAIAASLKENYPAGSGSVAPSGASSGAGVSGGTSVVTGGTGTGTTTTTPPTEADAATALATAPKNPAEVAALTIGDPNGTIAIYDTGSGQLIKVTPETLKNLMANPELANNVKIVYDPSKTNIPVNTGMPGSTAPAPGTVPAAAPNVVAPPPNTAYTGRGNENALAADKAISSTIDTVKAAGKLTNPIPIWLDMLGKGDTGPAGTYAPAGVEGYTPKGAVGPTPGQPPPNTPLFPNARRVTGAEALPSKFGVTASPSTAPPVSGLTAPYKPPNVGAEMSIPEEEMLPSSISPGTPISATGAPPNRLANQLPVGLPSPQAKMALPGKPAYLPPPALPPVPEDFGVKPPPGYTPSMGATPLSPINPYGLSGGMMGLPAPPPPNVPQGPVPNIRTGGGGAELAGLSNSVPPPPMAVPPRSPVPGLDISQQMPEMGPSANIPAPPPRPMPAPSPIASPVNPIELAPAPAARPPVSGQPVNPIDFSSYFSPKGLPADAPLPAPRVARKANAPVAPRKTGPVSLEEARATEPKEGSLDIKKIYPPDEKESGDSINTFNKLKGDVKNQFKKETGYDIKWLSLKRTPEDQYREWLKGRFGNKGKIVTPFDGYIGISEHQGNEAADFLFVDKKGKGVKQDYEKYSNLYNKLGQIVKENGLTWGGEWSPKSFDPGHFQLRDVSDKPLDKRSDAEKYKAIQVMRKKAGVKGVR